MASGFEGVHDGELTTQYTAMLHVLTEQGGATRIQRSGHNETIPVTEFAALTQA